MEMLTTSSTSLADQLLAMIEENQPKIYPGWTREQIAARLYRAMKERLLAVIKEDDTVTGFAIGAHCPTASVHIEAWAATNKAARKRLIEIFWQKFGAAASIEGQRHGKLVQYNIRNLRRLYYGKRI